ncbi:MAG: AAA family ATPase [bacterium]|nr:AAA family ATPase [bacterium]
MAFKVAIEDIDTIFEEALRPHMQNLFLGSAPLNKPALNIGTYLASDGEHYGVWTIIPLSAESGIDESILKRLCKKLKCLQVSNTLFVLNEKDEAEISVEWHKSPAMMGAVNLPAQNAIIISMGEAAGLVRKSLIALAKFSKEMDYFAVFVESIVNYFYDAVWSKAPEITMFLRLLKPWEPEDREDDFEEGHQAEKKEFDIKALEAKITMRKPKLAFSEIGGQPKAREEMEMLALGLQHPEIYKKWGTKLPKGILLYGPSGTGKTLLAEALAAAVDGNFIKVDVADIGSKWISVGEKMMQAVFDIAKKSKKFSIILCDEIDALASNRNYSHEANQRIVAVLLKNLDGLESAPNIMVIATTNRIESVDPAFLRPGRIDRKIKVPMPDFTGRKEIFNIHAQNSEKDAGRRLFEIDDWSDIASKTSGFSGADIAEIIRRVTEAKVRIELKPGQAAVPGPVVLDEVFKEIREFEGKTKGSKQIRGFRTNPVQ